MKVLNGLTEGDYMKLISTRIGGRYAYIKFVILIVFVLLAAIGAGRDYKLVRSFVQIICRACIGLLQAMFYI